MKELEAIWQNKSKHVTKEDLNAIIPKLITQKQVFGNIIEENLKNETQPLDIKELRNIFQKYWKITNKMDLDLLCRFIMKNPVDLNSSRITPKDLIRNYLELLKGIVMYSEEDFKETIAKIDDCPIKEQKEELITILKIFITKNGVAPEILISAISGCKIDVNKNCLLVYFMKKSKSILTINPEVLKHFWYRNTNLKEKSLENSKSSGTLKIAHMNLGSDEDWNLDKGSLKYKLRKAIRSYFSKILSERIAKFSRGQTMFKNDEEGSLTSEEIAKKFFLNLAEFLHKNNMPLIRIFNKYIFDSIYCQKEVQLIYIDDFFKSLREAGVLYTQRQKNEVTESLYVHDLNGQFLLEMIDKILNSLGVKRGLPQNTKAMNYESLDLKSIRIINRILKFASSELRSKENWFLNTENKNIRAENITGFIYEKLKPFIKVIEIVDAKGNWNDIEYIHSDDITKFLRGNYVYLEKKEPHAGKTVKFKSRIIKEMELHENLQFLICISANKALDKIMVKKFLALLATCFSNEYIQAIGAIKRADPKDEEEDEVAQVIEESRPKNLDEESDQDFEEYDLSDIDEKEQKKLDREKKMWERRKNRKSTKKLVI